MTGKEEEKQGKVSRLTAEEEQKEHEQILLSHAEREGGAPGKVMSHEGTGAPRKSNLSYGGRVGGATGEVMSWWRRKRKR